jgi:hypothetical protein
MPPYRLQTLLDIRTRAEEQAKEAFSFAVKEAEREKKKLAELRLALERRRAERKAKVRAFLEEMTEKGGGITGFQQMGRFEARLKDEEAQVELEIEAQRDVVAEAERVVELRRKEMADAAMDKKAIEKHKDTWTKQVRYERQQREELNQEEIGNALHLRRSRAEKKP